MDFNSKGTKSWKSVLMKCVMLCHRNWNNLGIIINYSMRLKLADQVFTFQNNDDTLNHECGSESIYTQSRFKQPRDLSKRYLKPVRPAQPSCAAGLEVSVCVCRWTAMRPGPDVSVSTSLYMHVLLFMTLAHHCGFIVVLCFEFLLNPFSFTMKRTQCFSGNVRHCFKVRMWKCW